MFSPPHVILL